MKIQHILVISSLSVTAAAGLTHQGGSEKKAEEVYKNIKTLKGVPASEVIPSMQFMCASLKVDCKFCHKEGDFADDSVRAKEAARHMIEMQKDINTKNFQGRTQVTCNTCHNGSPNPQRVPPLAGISRRTIARPSAPGGSTADILKKFASATGDLKAVVLEGTVTGFGPTPIPIKITEAVPNKFLYEFAGQRIGYDGTTAWTEQGGKATAVPTEGAGELINFGRFYIGDHAFDYLGELRLAGTDTIGGNAVTVLRAGAQNAKVSTDVYLDSASGLLARIAAYTTTPLGSIPSSAEFSDYRKVGNAMIPFQIARAGGENTITFKFEKATANPPLSATFFSMNKE